jgi:CRP-like cAMP-binding protein
VYEQFQKVLTDFVPSLTAEDGEMLKQLASPSQLTAGEALVREGEQGKQVAFINHGAVFYSTLRDGRRNVVGFDFEHSMAGDFRSFFENVPATKTVTALEDCEILTLTRAQFEALVEANPDISMLRSTIAEELFKGAEMRVVEMQSFSAEERYRRLLDRSPHLLQRVPLYLLASYIGVTPEALSRIRQRLSAGGRL